MKKSPECQYEHSNIQHPGPRQIPSSVFPGLLHHIGLFESLELLWVFDVGIWRCPPMRLGTVIGRVTLSAAVPALQGARWLIVSPFTREHFQRGTETPAGMSKEPSLVVYDDLGGGVGQTIGFIEGREAASPFDSPTPVDAINAALVDEIFYNPFTK